jgi:hypothetical protein
MGEEKIIENKAGKRIKPVAPLSHVRETQVPQVHPAYRGETLFIQ